ncbi:MAG: hypothetical protein HS111_16825 [Kofleriaceae bacterium]|nr:hypothetical protein [Kofleriaceae bacterium]
MARAPLRGSSPSPINSTTLAAREVGTIGRGGGGGAPRRRDRGRPRRPRADAAAYRAVVAPESAETTLGTVVGPA